MEKILITGANKGIGLQLVKQHINQGDHVVAVCRKPSDELIESDAQIISGINFLTDDFEQQLLSQIKDKYFDRVIVNAGVLLPDTFDDFNVSAIREQFEVNAIAPLRLIRVMEHLLIAGSKIILTSTRVASHQDNTSGGDYGYRMSKSALNMAGINLAISFRERGVGVFMLHPGFVRTELTKGEGLINTQESAKSILSLANKLDHSDSGSYWHAIEKKQLPL